MKLLIYIQKSFVALSAKSKDEGTDADQMHDWCWHNTISDEKCHHWKYCYYHYIIKLTNRTM